MNRFRTSVTNEEIEFEIKNVLHIYPRFFEGDEKINEEYRYIATRLGYNRKPRAIRLMLIPFCEGCWTNEVRSDTKFLVPCMSKPEHYVCSEECLKKLDFCPFDCCNMKNVKLELL